MSLSGPHYIELWAQYQMGSSLSGLDHCHLLVCNGIDSIKRVIFDRRSKIWTEFKIFFSLSEIEFWRRNRWVIVDGKKSSLFKVGCWILGRWPDTLATEKVDAVLFDIGTSICSLSWIYWISYKNFEHSYLPMYMFFYVCLLFMWSAYVLLTIIYWLDGFLGF